MDNFKVIYQILKYLEGAMDYAEPDYTPIQAEALGLTEERWKALIKMLIKDGYVEGVTIKTYMRSTDTIVQFAPVITLKGLEYLHENSMMQKIMRAAKGIKDVLPGM